MTFVWKNAKNRRNTIGSIMSSSGYWLYYLMVFYKKVFGLKQYRQKQHFLIPLSGDSTKSPMRYPMHGFIKVGFAVKKFDISVKISNNQAPKGWIVDAISLTLKESKEIF